MNVGELRKALEGVSDDVEVVVESEDVIWSPVEEAFMFVYLGDGHTTFIIRFENQD